MVPRRCHLSGDGIFSHIFIGAADLQKSVAFYDAALGALGIKNLGPFNNGWVLFGREKPAFIIARPGNGEAPSSNGVTDRLFCQRPQPLPLKWSLTPPPSAWGHREGTAGHATGIRGTVLTC